MTKRDLIRYFAALAPAMLPYLADRPVNLRRYPGRRDRQAGFWQKAVPPHAPDWSRRWRNEDADPGETEWYSWSTAPAALAWLANDGAVELHPWTSTTEDPDEPSWAMFDLDPGEATSFDDLLVLARLHRSRARAPRCRGLPEGDRTSAASRSGAGRAGLLLRGHPRIGWSSVSRAVGATVPELVSWEWHKDERKGLARLDYTQNAINKTLVSPFSPRPAPGAPVSVPISWDELDDPALRPDRWTIRTALDRIEEQGDPMAAALDHPQRLPSLD